MMIFLVMICELVGLVNTYLCFKYSQYNGEEISVPEWIDIPILTNIIDLQYVVALVNKVRTHMRDSLA